MRQLTRSWRRSPPNRRRLGKRGNETGQLHSGIRFPSPKMQVDRWYRNLPIITKAYITACCLTTLAAHLELISALDIFLNFNLVIQKMQARQANTKHVARKTPFPLPIPKSFHRVEFVIFSCKSMLSYNIQFWRLITNFFYFGQFDLSFIFHMTFLYPPCRRLFSACRSSNVFRRLFTLMQGPIYFFDSSNSFSSTAESTTAGNSKRDPFGAALRTSSGSMYLVPFS